MAPKKTRRKKQPKSRGEKRKIISVSKPKKKKPKKKSKKKRRAKKAVRSVVSVSTGDVALSQKLADSIKIVEKAGGLKQAQQMLAAVKELEKLK